MPIRASGLAAQAAGNPLACSSSWSCDGDDRAMGSRCRVISPPLALTRANSSFLMNSGPHYFRALTGAAPLKPDGTSSTTLLTMANFRALTGAAPLKPHRHRVSSTLPAHFRALTGAAPLKRCGFPCN